MWDTLLTALSGVRDGIEPYSMCDSVAQVQV